MKAYSRFIVFIIIALLLTLPFHYVFYSGKFTMFPKNQLTFSGTLLTEEDISEIITRYNNANLFERQAINAEPLVRKLREKKILVDLKNTYNSTTEKESSVEEDTKSNYDARTQQLEIKSEINGRKLRYLFHSNGGLIGYFADGNVVTCARCDFSKSEVESLFSETPSRKYSVLSDGTLIDDGVAEKPDPNSGWAMIDFLWHEKPSY